jgi:hypothetical protein
MPKITELPLASGLTNDDCFVMVNDTAGASPETQKITAENILNFINTNLGIVDGGYP